MRDPYEVLGVQKTDSDAAIRSAYRKLAKRHHPDVNPGKPEAAERFKEISGAYDLLGDKEKRARYDRGEIDASGNEVPPQRPFYRDFGDTAGREKYRADAGFDAEDLESIFAQAFGGRAGTAGGRRFSMRGQDARYELTLDFLDAVNGATRASPCRTGARWTCAFPPECATGR
jgi:DnaJ-class molecular chaperone